MNVFLMIMRKIQPHSCQIITDNNFFRVILRIKSYNCLFYKRFVKKMLLISNESDYEGSIWPVSRRINRFLINSLERYLNFSGSNIEINFKKKIGYWHEFREGKSLFSLSIWNSSFVWFEIIVSLRCFSSIVFFEQLFINAFIASSLITLCDSLRWFSNKFYNFVCLK